MNSPHEPATYVHNAIFFYIKINKCSFWCIFFVCYIKALDQVRRTEGVAHSAALCAGPSRAVPGRPGTARDAWSVSVYTQDISMFTEHVLGGIHSVSVWSGRQQPPPPLCTPRKAAEWWGVKGHRWWHGWGGDEGTSLHHALVILIHRLLFTGDGWKTLPYAFKVKHGIYTFILFFPLWELCFPDKSFLFLEKVLGAKQTVMYCSLMCTFWPTVCVSRHHLNPTL